MQRVCSVLIAVLIHIQSRHRELRLCRIGRIGIIVGEFVCDGLGIVEAALVNVLGQCFKQLGRLDLRLQFAALVLVETDQQADRDNHAGNHIAAVLSPPRFHLINLFFF